MEAKKKLRYYALFILLTTLCSVFKIFNKCIKIVLDFIPLFSPESNEDLNLLKKNQKIQLDIWNTKYRLLF